MCAVLKEQQQTKAWKTHKERLLGEGVESLEKPDEQPGRKDFSHKGDWQGDRNPLFYMSL